MAKEKSKILVLDDDPVVTLSCKRIHGAEGYDITTVEKGGDALERMAKEEFDLLISDIRLPDINGLTVLKESRVLQPDTDVVIITGYPTLEDAKESIKLGAFEYIEKPFTPDFMLNVARKIFDKRGWILRQAYIEEFRDSVVSLRDQKNPVIFYKEGIWARPIKEGLWEIGCDIRNEMVSGEMLYVDYIRDLDEIKAGEPFARLLTSSGAIRDLNSPMTAEIRELNLKANDVICSLQKEHASEGWLVWMARVFPIEL